MENTYLSPSQLIFGGFVVFGLCAALGLRLLHRGIRGDVLDQTGAPKAGKGWFVVGGVLCLVPLAAYTFFLWTTGYFGHVR